LKQISLSIHSSPSAFEWQSFRCVWAVNGYNELAGPLIETGVAVFRGALEVLALTKASVPLRLLG
jgi:hypothetical protein